MFRERETGSSLFRLDRVAARELFGACWLGLLKTRINLAQYKRVLVMLQEKVTDSFLSAASLSPCRQKKPFKRGHFPCR